jgi:bifunctional DNA primase/polymerase-like protein
MSQQSKTPIEALNLAQQGLVVFPVLENKAPACPHGFKHATCDRAGVEHLWRHYPGPLVGVPTGEVTRIDVLDIDPRHGGDRWLEVERYRVPITRQHRTRSGGLHLLFRHRAGIRNSAGRIAPGVDVRGTGGYVIWWPAAGLLVENANIIADWPGWLLEVLAPKPHTRSVSASIVSGDGYAIAALRLAVDAVVSAAPGTRNDVLNREAFGLFRFVESGELDPQQIVNALAAAGLAAGLPESEVRRTLQSAMRARGLLP